MPSKFRAKRFALVISCVFIFSYVYLYDSITGRTYHLDSDLENTSVCHIPALPQWPKDWSFTSSKINCQSDDRNWVFVSKGKIIFRDEFFQEHDGFSCKQAALSSQDYQVFYNNSLLLHDVTNVVCKGGDRQLFTATLLGVVPVQGSVGQERPSRTGKKNSKLIEEGLNLDIIMLGFDSVSRLMWQRELPKSIEKFKSIGGVVLEKYNIIGDGTPQALLPILTGKTEVELPEARRGFPNATSVDGHPWIWRELKKRGYVTQWGEDSPRLGTFTYRMLGFKNQPVDHYMEPFFLRTNIGVCYDQLPSHHIFFNFLRELTNVYDKDQRKFSFLFHSTYSHDSDAYLNTADDDLVNLLSELEASGALDRSLIILMADHGARFSKFRATEQGKYEERLPFMALRVPQNHHFKANFPHIHTNLLKNAHKLSSPFDIHATFLDVLNYKVTPLPKHHHPSLKRPYARGISLFRPLPDDRMCADIGIETHWCSCMRHTPYPVDDRLTTAFATFAIEHINALLADYRSECAVLSLERVMYAVRMNTNKNLLAFKQSADSHGRLPDLSDNMAGSIIHMMLTISTLPNHAAYEVTLSNEPMAVHQISRINKYGDQPKCIMDEHPHLRAYCYCIE